jgi:Tfp pilus assembly protein PilF
VRGDSLRGWLLGLMAGAGIAVSAAGEAGAQAVSPLTGQQATFAGVGQPTGGLSASIKAGIDKLVRMATPQPQVIPADDPVSLATKANPGAELYVAVARLCEESGRLEEAEGNYQKALKGAPDNLPALLGYARLKDSMGQPAEARALYRKAAETHPKTPSVFNNLGLFCAEHGLPEESAAAFGRAVELQPNNAKYRNNFARLLVSRGQVAEAFAQLSAVHTPAVAHYNLAYLLEQQGQLRAAGEHLALARQQDPSLVSATRVVERAEVASPETPAVATRQRPSEEARQSARPPQPVVQREAHRSPDAGGHLPAGQAAGVSQPSSQAVRGTGTTAAGSSLGQAPLAVPGASPPSPQRQAPSAAAAPLPPMTEGLASGAGQASPPVARTVEIVRLPPVSAEVPAAAAAPLPPSSYRWEPTPTAPLPPEISTGAELQRLPRTY